MTTVATSRWVAPARTWGAARGFVLVRAEFCFLGRWFAAQETIFSKIEIYDHYPDGMERFVGFVGDAALPAQLAMAAVEALCSGRTP